MDRLIYTAYSGMTGSMVRQRVIASNMANAQTIGFRQEILSATPITLKGPSLEARAMTEGYVQGASMKQGTTIATNNPLDVALSGDTMLTVQPRTAARPIPGAAIWRSRPMACCKTAMACR
jgi:flagellar basal-body rod protein FlgF